MDLAALHLSMRRGRFTSAGAREGLTRWPFAIIGQPLGLSLPKRFWGCKPCSPARFNVLTAAIRKHIAPDPGLSWKNTFCRCCFCVRFAAPNVSVEAVPRHLRPFGSGERKP